MGSSHFDRDRDADAIIDRAVREILSVEPRADMRQRVLARLADRPARTITFPRLALASGLLAVIVAVIVWQTRPIERTPAIVDRAPVAQVAPPAPAAAPKTTPPEPNTNSTLAMHHPSDATPGEIPRGQVVAQSVEVEGAYAPFENVEPLDEPAPLSMRNISSPAPAIADIPVDEIVIKNLRVDPLGSHQ